MPHVGEGERLVEKGERVACRPGCAAHEDVDDLVVGLDAFAAEDVGEVAGELVVCEERELEVLGARPDRGEDLAGVGRRQHEDDVLGWFFEGLQQGVRRGGAEHVHLVDDVDLATRRRAEADADALDEVAYRVDAVVRRGVELGEVVEGARRNRRAVLALTARLSVAAGGQAVERLREEASGGRLAGATRAGEEVRVADTVFADCVAQCRAHVILADQLREALGSVPAVERLRGHALTLPRCSDSGPRTDAAVAAAGRRGA